MLDSVNVERMGIPALTIATQPFVPAARAVARSQGLPDIPLVVVPHDYLTEDMDDIRAKLLPHFDEIMTALFGVPG